MVYFHFLTDFDSDNIYYHLVEMVKKKLKKKDLILMLH